MRRLILLMAAMGATVLLVSGVAYALSVQCDGPGDQDPDPGQCQGTEQNDRITGSQEGDEILALGGLDVVTALGGDDFVYGGRGRDDISGGVGADTLRGGGGPDDIDGGPGTTDASEPPNNFACVINDDDAGIEAFTLGNQVLAGDNANDDLDGGKDNDLLQGDNGRNDLSGTGGADCLTLVGAENERASGGDGDDLVFADDSNADDVFCGAGHDTVSADVEDRVAANCEDVLRQSSLQASAETLTPEMTPPNGVTLVQVYP